ncbi:succinylglutamate desuccinylase/aspartoacylase family protein [Rhodovulum sulfidophilum]|uniref:succinylglutamate desuccinylase/aspartoacylase family protein n=1 Tax=Rhodovulum sulfidophilum TaxID=35806 RepID=UPI001923809D|nr:succinylglutamate desuccinylase/aspartoacylase family protein [Rhodovulum sulfidophilum]MBL3562516.1 succinylglutamate desuccinylase/aspartoacylase family protein [Rhodovulum sulfidophilum]
MTARAEFTLGRETVPPGSRRTVDLPVSVLSDHTPVTLSAHVVHGRRPGPAMFVTAGVHGDEVIGVEIVRRLLSLPVLGALRGTLIAIPIVNAFGFLNLSRYLPDRRDLNRCFPGSSGGSMAARLAHLLVEEVVGRCQIGIDLHSAAVHRTNLPQVRVVPDDPELARLARVFAAPVVLSSEARQGSLRETAARMGVQMLLYEGGEGLRFDEVAVRAGLAGVLRVMFDRGMIPAKGVPKARRAPLDCRVSRWLRAPQGGLLRTYRSEGDVVAEGELLAVVSDPFGEIETEIRATEPGIIVGRAMLPVVNEGNAVFHLAAIAPADRAEDRIGAWASEVAAGQLFDEDEIL